MRGYHSLPDDLDDASVDAIHDAERLVTDGDHQGARAILERLLERALESTYVIPDWICGRLATVYRKLELYEDELDLLERYKSAHTDGFALTRFDSRISKARALVARMLPAESGALASVRVVRMTPRRNARQRGA